MTVGLFHPGDVIAVPIPLRPGNVAAYDNAYAAWKTAGEKYDLVRRRLASEVFLTDAVPRVTRAALDAALTAQIHAVNVISYVWNFPEDISYDAAYAAVESKFESGEYR
jgi:hypothetical protein